MIFVYVVRCFPPRRALPFGTEGHKRQFYPKTYDGLLIVSWLAAERFGNSLARFRSRRQRAEMFGGQLAADVTGLRITLQPRQITPCVPVGPHDAVVR